MKNFFFLDEKLNKGIVRYIEADTKFPDFPIKPVVRKINKKIGTLGLNYLVTSENKLVVNSIGAMFNVQSF